MRPSSLYPSLLLCLVLIAASPLYAQPKTLSVAYGNLIEIDVSNGEWDLIGDTDAEGCCTALTQGQGDQLLGLGNIFAGGAQIYAIDRQTAETSLLASFDMPGSALERSADGRLWMAWDQTVYSVDLDAATLTPFATLDRSINALAARGSQLYALTSPEGVTRINADGSTTFLYDVDIDSQSIIGASFDAVGELRFLTVGGGILSIVPHGFYHVDLPTGLVTETYFEAYFFGALQAGMDSMSIQGGNSPVAIPTLHPVGLFFMIALLAASAVAVSRRRI